MTPNPWSNWLLRSRSRTVRCPLRPSLWAWKVQPALSASVGTLSPSSFQHHSQYAMSSFKHLSSIARVVQCEKMSPHLKGGFRCAPCETAPFNIAYWPSWRQARRPPRQPGRRATDIGRCICRSTIREFVKSRYANPEDGWNGETQRQYDLAQTACSMVAREYVESGYCCAIDDAVPIGQKSDMAGGRLVLGPMLIVLLPSFDKVLERNRARSGNSHLKEPTLRITYDRMIEWRDHSDTVVIDNSDLTIDETVEALDRS